MGRFIVSVLLKDVKCDAEWVATSVYGPGNVNEKVDFWAELNQVAGLWNRPWMLGEWIKSGRYIGRSSLNGI